MGRLGTRRTLTASRRLYFKKKRISRKYLNRTLTNNICTLKKKKKNCELTSACLALFREEIGVNAREIRLIGSIIAEDVSAGFKSEGSRGMSSYWMSMINLTDQESMFGTDAYLQQHKYTAKYSGEQPPSFPHPIPIGFLQPPLKGKGLIQSRN